MIRKNDRRLAILLALILSLGTACDMATTTSDTSQTDVVLQRDAESDTESPGGNTSDGSGDSGDVKVDRAVVAETLPYAEVGEQLVYGHFAFPADMVDPLPGIIVIHERWGLDDGVRTQAARLAAQGYVVLAIDLFGGKTAGDVAAARPLMVEVVENPELAEENIRQAYQFLAESGQAPAIGVLGWSFGGGWALNTALLFPDDLDAAVIFYGPVTDNIDRLAPLNVPVLGIFGNNDRGVTSDTVESFETAMGSLGKDLEIVMYPNVGHAFADPGAATYNAEVAEQAWSLVADFLRKHLAGDSE